MTEGAFALLYLAALLRQAATNRWARRRLVERIARRFTTRRRALDIARRIP